MKTAVNRMEPKNGKLETKSEIHIEPFKIGRAILNIIGTSPLIYNSMSEKTRQELLFPGKKKTSADKQQNMKHSPIDEYRNSFYKRSGEGPTRLMFPASAFKAAICNAALEIPGTKKSQIGRLVWVVGDMVDVYGVPKMLMSVVRSSDINRTPDVRTRGILTEWCCSVNIQFAIPSLNESSIATLFSTAGLIIGVGDYRQEKGKGNYGQFSVANLEAKQEIASIVKSGGMKVQDEAIKSPTFYDVETQSLYNWFVEEKQKRGR